MSGKKQARIEDLIYQTNKLNININIFLTNPYVKYNI